MVTAGVETDDYTHRFPLAREGDHLDDLGRLACFLQILPTDVLGKLKKGSLGLGSYESKLFGLGVSVFEGSWVDHDQLVGRAFQLGGMVLALSCSIEKLSACLRFAWGSSAALGCDILFLGLILLLIGRVRAGLVLLEVADEFGMDTDGAGDDAHDVMGERSGLVGADNGGVCHRLTRTETTNELFLSHPFRGESDRKSDHKWEVLRNSDNDHSR